MSYLASPGKYSQMLFQLVQRRRALYKHQRLLHFRPQGQQYTLDEQDMACQRLMDLQKTVQRYRAYASQALKDYRQNQVHYFTYEMQVELRDLVEQVLTDAIEMADRYGFDRGMCFTPPTPLLVEPKLVLLR